MHFRICTWKWQFAWLMYSQNYTMRTVYLYCYLTNSVTVSRSIASWSELVHSAYSTIEISAQLSFELRTRPFNELWHRCHKDRDISRKCSRKVEGDMWMGGRRGGTAFEFRSSTIRRMSAYPLRYCFSLCLCLFNRLQHWGLTPDDMKDMEGRSRRYGCEIIEKYPRVERKRWALAPCSSQYTLLLSQLSY